MTGNGTAERVMTANQHVSYPHHPGEMYDCPACESQCFCTPDTAACVHCALAATSERVMTADERRTAAHVAAWDVLTAAEQQERYAAGIALQAGSIQL